MINKHVPVLLEESIVNLNIKKNGVYVDCTFGSGGHSREILSKLGENGKLISFDCDSSVKEWLKNINDQRFFFINDNFSNLFFYLDEMKIKSVDGFLFDLGLSSMQLELPRGFSYRQNDSLDMRMNQNETLNAEKIVNEFSEQEIANIIYELGEERKSYKISKAICNSRKRERITNSEDLTRIITGVLGKQKNKQHPAKKTFQALRIKVNNELENLTNTVNSIFKYLSENGRIVIISYHSLEDRIVKNIFKKKMLEDKSFDIFSKKPIIPNKEEIEFNNRARSAKLRFIGKN